MILLKKRIHWCSSILRPTVSVQFVTGILAFEINEDTKNWLQHLEAPIGVISVAGMYRTGKSYLLNRMLLNQSRGFDVGPTINACTKVSQFRSFGTLAVAALRLLELTAIHGLTTIF